MLPPCICELSYTSPGSIVFPVGLAGWWWVFLNGQPLVSHQTELYDFQIEFYTPSDGMGRSVDPVYVISQIVYIHPWHGVVLIQANKVIDHQKAHQPKKL